MPAYQAQLPLPRPYRARVRSNRRPFVPAHAGPYRLPHEVREGLTSALAPYRNREAAFALAVFLARFWSPPGRLGLPFIIDRRALTDHPALGLTQSRVRGAVRVLEEIGFLDRLDLSSGSKYHPTPDGLRRKPVAFQISAEYASVFRSANKRAAEARGRRERDHRPITPPATPRPSTAFLEARPLRSPKWHSEAVSQVYSGDLRKENGFLPSAFEDNPALGVSLGNLLKGIRRSRGT